MSDSAGLKIPTILHLLTTFVPPIPSFWNRSACQNSNICVINLGISHTNFNELVKYIQTSTVIQELNLLLNKVKNSGIPLLTYS